MSGHNLVCEELIARNFDGLRGVEHQHVERLQLAHDGQAKVVDHRTEPRDNAVRQANRHTRVDNVLQTVFADQEIAQMWRDQLHFNVLSSHFLGQSALDVAALAPFAAVDQNPAAQQGLGQWTLEESRIFGVCATQRAQL